jgi:hypothetical protein
LLSSEHFSVDGTLIEAWSAVKSMRRRDGKDDPPPREGLAQHSGIRVPHPDRLRN